MVEDVPDPFSLPEWQAIHREASLVNQLIGSGVTALGRANYANGFGEYYSAFFGLSIGIERLAKLILIADFACDNNGLLPKQSVVRKFGHNIQELIDQIDAVSVRNKIQGLHGRPMDPICAAIISCLDAFADASVGRYANFEAIGNSSFDSKSEPVNRWWIDVAEPILDKHYRSQKREAKVRQRAAALASIMDEYAIVLHFDENHKALSDFRSASERTGQTAWIQLYSRYYTLLIVRWLAEIFRAVTFQGAYERRIECLFGHYEILRGYMTEDRFLRSRKIWPIA